MKNILVAAIFLFSQLGLTAEKANQVKTTKAKTTQAQTKKKFQIENLTFSGLLLSKEEIIHLSEEDKQAYLFAMISLAQIIEGSQQFHMGYEDKVVGSAKNENSVENVSNKYAAIFYAIFPLAHAWGAVLLRAGPALATAGRWVVTHGKGVFSKSATAAPGAVQMTEQMALDLIPSKAALAKLGKAVADKAKNLQKAQEDALNALKKKRGAHDVLKEEVKLSDARTALAKEKDAFLKAGGTPEQLAKVAEESGLKKVLMWPLRNKKDLAVGGLAGYGLDTILLDKTGSDTVGWAAQAWTSTKNWITGTDLSGPAILTPEQIKALKAGDSSKGLGNACLFGGIRSVWTDQGESGIKCTRPAEASNAECKQEDNKFQCPNYEIKLVNETINKSLCLDTQKTGDLTVRCAGALKAILAAKAATTNSLAMAEGLQKNFGEVLAGLEARDRMKNDKGETKSIFEYCMADNVEQKEECGAIKEVLALLKTTDVKKVYETRMLLGQVTPAQAPAATAPAGASPAEDAAAAGTKQ